MQVIKNAMHTFAMVFPFYDLLRRSLPRINGTPAGDDDALEAMKPGTSLDHPLQLIEVGERRVQHLHRR